MKGVSEFNNIYLYCEYIDFRKGVNGLSTIVENQMKLQAMDGVSLFLFCNKNRDKIKILYWDKTGFALWYKSLEKDRFKWPKKIEKEKVILSQQELEWLLEGIDIQKIKKHKECNYNFAS